MYFVRMKVYRIPPLLFWVIFLLVLLLPLSREWKLLIWGQSAGGTVAESYERVDLRAGRKHWVEELPVVEFRVGDQLYKAYGRSNHHYEAGRRLTVRYDARDPSVNSIMSFQHFYLRPYSALMIILLVLWAAFATSFNSYSRRKLKGFSKLGGNSPKSAS